MVVGVRRQSRGEIDAPSIEQFTIVPDGDEDGRIAVFGDSHCG